MHKLFLVLFVLCKIMFFTSINRENSKKIVLLHDKTSIKDNLSLKISNNTNYSKENLVSHYSNTRNKKKLRLDIKKAIEYNNWNMYLQNYKYNENKINVHKQKSNVYCETKTTNFLNTDQESKNRITRNEYYCYKLSYMISCIKIITSLENELLELLIDKNIKKNITSRKIKNEEDKRSTYNIKDLEKINKIWESVIISINLLINNLEQMNDIYCLVDKKKFKYNMFGKIKICICSFNDSEICDDRFIWDVCCEITYIQKFFLDWNTEKIFLNSTYNIDSYHLNYLTKKITLINIKYYNDNVMMSFENIFDILKITKYVNRLKKVFQKEE